MIRKILIPTDFSPYSNQAVRYGFELAEELKASVDLLYVFGDFDRAAGNHLPEEMLHHLEAGRMEVALLSFEEYYAKPEFGKVPSLTTHLAQGEAIDQILAHSEQLKVDLIIMGTEDRKKKTAHLGSVTEAVIDRASMPVLAVPENSSASGISRIVYASNFEHLDPGDSEQLLEMAAWLGASLSCVHVEQKPTAWTKMNESMFDLVFEQEQGRQAVSFYFIHSENVSEGLKDFLETHEADLLILMHRDQSEIPEGQSLTRHMTGEIQVPLMALHERAPASN